MMTIPAFSRGPVLRALLFSLFASVASANATFTVLKTFDNASAASDGAAPMAPLAIRADGTLFGTTNGGGAQGLGTVYRVNSDDTGFAAIKPFDSAVSGYNAIGGVLLGSDGRLYGATNAGGPTGRGTIFRVDADGSNFAVLHAFAANSSEGSSTWAGLAQGPDGLIYGATQMGGGAGGSGWGTLYRLNTDGSGFMVLHVFANDANGGRPNGTPAFGSDGKLYGTTWTGGSASSQGTVYRMNLDGTGFTVLFTFTGAATGEQPYGGVTVTPAGDVFGTTQFGGLYGGGVVYTLKTDGSGFSVLRHLRSSNPEGNGAFNAVPVIAGGRLYATAGFNGTSGGAGSLFSMNPDGSDFVVEAGFDGAASGGNPLSGVRPGPDGRLYGTARNGGVNGAGTIFRLGSAIAAPVITSAASATGGYGTSFSYAIVASNSPTTYGASPLPAGLSLDTATGLISGTLPASPGTYTIGLSATNAGGTATSTLALTVVDLVPPVITAPTTLTAEATSPAGAVVTFTATATDVISGNVVASATPASGSTFGLGLSTVSLSATDGAGNTATQNILVNVTDTTAPVITSLVPSVATLWPANHKLVHVALDASATDAVGVTSLKIINVTSSEPDNGLGDGDTAGDIAVTGPLTVDLRAERSGTGTGRTYTITVEARDAAGHATTKATTVTVPKNRAN
jgi:uncharacterized repeat protein (TIGR03803 family)